MVVRNVKKIRRKICSSDEHKKKSLHHFKCLSDGKTKEKIQLFRSVVNGWTKVATYIAKETSPDIIIPNLCCSFHFLYEDSVFLLNEQCSATTGNETAEYIMNFVKSGSDDLMDIGCATHKSLEYCRKTMPNELQIFKNLSDTGRKEPFSVTPVVPLLKIATNLDLVNL